MSFLRKSLHDEIIDNSAQFDYSAKFTAERIKRAGAEQQAIINKARSAQKAGDQSQFRVLFEQLRVITKSQKREENRYAHFLALREKALEIEYSLDISRANHTLSKLLKRVLNTVSVSRAHSNAANYLAEAELQRRMGILEQEAAIDTDEGFEVKDEDLIELINAGPDNTSHAQVDDVETLRRRIIGEGAAR